MEGISVYLNFFHILCNFYRDQTLIYALLYHSVAFIFMLPISMLMQHTQVNLLMTAWAELWVDSV